MKLRHLISMAALSMLAACATGDRAAIPGVESVGKMQVTMSEGWTIVPASETPRISSLSKTYTRDGLPHDRLILISGIDSGDPILRDAGGSVFRASMSPNDLEQLVGSTIPGLYGNAAATVSASNQRPQGFGADGGILFDVELAVADSPDNKGIAGAFIAEERLFAIVYLAEEPGSYQKHLDAAMDAINSVSIRVSTTGKF